MCFGIGRAAGPGTEERGESDQQPQKAAVTASSSKLKLLEGAHRSHCNHLCRAPRLRLLPWDMLSPGKRLLGVHSSCAPNFILAAPSKPLCYCTTWLPPWTFTPEVAPVFCTCWMKPSVAITSCTQHKKITQALPRWPTQGRPSLSSTAKPPVWAAFALSKLLRSTVLSMSRYTRKAPRVPCHPLFRIKLDFALGIVLVKAVIVILLGCIKSYLRMDLLSISLRGTLPKREPIHYWRKMFWPH